MSTEDAWFIAERLREILESRHFNKDDFEGRPLKLSQAFCLLWQNKNNGEVSGRQRAGRTANAAVLAVLLDLFVLGKIEFEAQVKQWIALGRRRQITYVKVRIKVDKYCPKSRQGVSSHYKILPSIIL